MQLWCREARNANCREALKNWTGLSHQRTTNDGAILQNARFDATFCGLDRLTALNTCYLRPPNLAELNPQTLSYFSALPRSSGCFHLGKRVFCDGKCFEILFNSYSGAGSRLAQEGVTTSMAKKEKADSKTETGANLGLEAKLWAAADALRNNMDAAEYKHVFLGPQVMASTA
jgi:hypothetical protein